MFMAIFAKKSSYDFRYMALVHFWFFNWNGHADIDLFW